jgi:hypothetical protein
MRGGEEIPPPGSATFAGPVEEEPGIFDSIKESATSALETTKNELGSELGSQTEQVKAEAAQLTGQIQDGLIEAKEQGSGFLDSINPFSSNSGSVTGSTGSVTGSTGSVTGSTGAVNGSTGAKEEEKGMFSSFFSGGKRRRRSRQLMGGRTLDFGYDAAPVTDMNVAQPTYMMTSGGKRRRRTCKKKRKCCKKSCRKRHRHHRK